MIKYLWKNKILILLLLLAVWLVPLTISIPEQSRSETIVIGVGVDKKDEEYEVTLQYIVSNASSNAESLETKSIKDKSVDGAIQRLNKKIGKYSGFAHCRVLIFNEEAGKENFTKILDSFLRRKTNTNNIVLINTKESSKDILEATNKLDSELYTLLNNLSFSSEMKGYEDLKSIGDYYQSFFGFTKCLAVNVLDLSKSDLSLEEKQNSTSSNSSGNEGSSKTLGQNNNSGQTSSSSNSKEILNDGKLFIFKNSKQLLTLDKEKSENVNWFNDKITKVDFEVKNYQDENLTNASLRFHLLNKKVSTKSYFKNEIPTFDINIKIFLRTAEIVADNLKQEDYEVQQPVFTQKMYNAIKEDIINKMKKAEEDFKLNNYDIINCQEKFYKFCNKDYKNYINKLQNKDEFIKNVVFNYNVQIEKGN